MQDEKVGVQLGFVLVVRRRQEDRNLSPHLPVLERARQRGQLRRRHRTDRLESTAPRVEVRVEMHDLAAAGDAEVGATAVGAPSARVDQRDADGQALGRAARRERHLGCPGVVAEPPQTLVVWHIVRVLRRAAGVTSLRGASAVRRLGSRLERLTSWV